MEMEGNTIKDVRNLFRIEKEITKRQEDNIAKIKRNLVNLKK